MDHYFNGKKYDNLTALIMAVRINYKKHNTDRSEQPRMTLNEFAWLCRCCAETFYRDPVTGKKKDMNPGERFMLAVTELSESFEALRKDKMDDHLPHRRGVEVEMTDALIREFDFSYENELDLDGAFWEKLLYNATRADPKPENRALPGGKKW